MIPPKVEVALICDDVRREDNGKLIAIGIYASDIVVESFPTTVTLKLMASLRAIETGEVKFELQALGNRKVLSRGRGSINVTYAGLSMIGIGPMRCSFTEPTTLRVRIKFGDGRFRTVAKLDVDLADDAVASKP